MKGLLLEEAYEVVDTINGRDFDGLEDELGDLLFQIVFYARLAEEERRFTLDDVIERLHAKLVRRHPHVFGETRARTPEEALQSWLTVKEREQQEARSKEQEGRSRKQGARSKEKGTRRAAASSHAPPTAPTWQPFSLLDGIPKALPATLEAYELGVRAAEVGFDWAKIEDLVDKVAEEVAELRNELVRPSLDIPRRGTGSLPRPVGLPPLSATAKACPDPAVAGEGMAVPRLEEEVGDLLFAVGNLARYLGSDPESCLRRANQKFKGRFRALEQEVAKLGKKVRDCTPEELDRLWNAVKSRERGGPKL
jgi:MazG family protein